MHSGISNTDGIFALELDNYWSLQWCGKSPFACKESNIIFVYDDDGDDDDNGDYNDNDDFNAVACLHLDMLGR